MTTKKYLTLALFFGIVLFTTMFFRKYPVDFPQLASESRRQVERNLRYQMAQNMHRLFPGLDTLAREQLIDVAASDYKAKNREQIRQDVINGYRSMKDRYQDASGRTYLMELDCWHWTRYTENVYRLGHPGDMVADGREVDNLMVAPLGSPIPFNQLLFYLSAWLYKIYSSFTHNPLPIFNFTFYLPLFYFEVFILILYLCCLSRWGNLGAAITCLFVGLSPLFLRRSCAGWFDMDIFALLFPVLIAWFYVMGRNAPLRRNKLLWLALAGLLSGLFCFMWLAWWFIYIIIAAYEILSVLLLMLSKVQKNERNREELGRALYFLGFLVFSAFWVVIFCGMQPLTSLYSQAKAAIALNDSVTVSVWPNTFSTVSELKKAGLKDIMLYLGAIPFIASVTSLAAFFILARVKKEEHPFDRDFSALMLCWFLVMFFACLKGTRFTMFLIIPLGISLGASFSWGYRILKKKNVFAAIAFILALGAIIVNMVFSAQATAANIYPMMDDGWHRFLLNLQKNTPKDAVINSWWDYGDWFKAVSRRKVIFDGQSQHLPQAYWMAHVLMASDENEALNTLRMLNNGGNKAFEIINSELKDPFASAMLLEKALNSSRVGAKSIFAKALSQPCAEKAASLIFDNPKHKAYFVVDYEMPRKIASISFLGTWNFSKAFLSKNALKLGKDKSVGYLIRRGLDKKQAETLYQEFSLISPDKFDSWISQPMRYFSGPLTGQERDGQVFFLGGLVFNPAKKTVLYYSEEENRYKVPRSLFMVNKGKLEETAYPKSDIDTSALILKTRGGYRAYIIPRKLGESMMSRLYFLNGLGLKNFKFVFSEDRGDNFITVFEIDWGK